MPALRSLVLGERVRLEVREECLRALGELRDVDWLREQLPHLRYAAQWQVRWALAQALVEAGASESAELLSNLQADAEVPKDLRRRARTWLRKLSTQ